MNVKAYPKAPNPYDSFGDAYSAAGRLQDARRSYERAVGLAEQGGTRTWRLIGVSWSG
jgi:hypothetical protein